MGAKGEEGGGGGMRRGRESGGGGVEDGEVGEGREELTKSWE